jgi:hypothetical protein
MKHSIEELFEVVYRHYPRGRPCQDLGRMQTEENRRLEDARRRAGAECERWLGMLRRLRERFPESGIDDWSVHLATGRFDACYSGALYLPENAGECRRVIGLKVSFLVPCYIVYRSRLVDAREEVEEREALHATSPRVVTIFVHDTVYVLPAWVGKLIRLVKPELVEPPPEEPERRQDVSFDLSPDEQPYAAGIAQEIEATWGYVPMPPELGSIIVPDVATDSRPLGQATLYDCLFSDNW